MIRKLLCMAVAGLALLACGQNLVDNPSFEEWDEKGFPKGWWCPGPNWHGSEEAAYEGKRSLLFDNEDPKEVHFISKSVKVVPGKSYQYSAVFKCLLKPGAPEKILPNIRIFLEYSKNGKYSGGQYSCTTTPLNNEWKRIEGKATIPMDVTGVTVALVQNPRNSIYPRMWVDCVELHEVENGVFACLPVTDCYRDEAADGMVKVLCGRCEGIAPVPEEALRKSVVNLMQDGKTVLTANATELLPDRLVYEFDAAKLPVGKYIMQCKVVHPETGKEYTSENRFTRLATKPNYKVSIDKKRRMIVDGKPFFPLGMYHMSPSKENLKAYLDSDFNCLMPYQPPKDKEMLDYIHEHNLKLIYAAANVSSRTKDKEKTKATHEGGYRKIEQFKNHPAIIAWYINDELPATFVQDAIDYRQGCQEHDPDRPTWTVLCHPGEFLTFLPASDIHGSDPYPIPDGDISTAYKMSKKSYDATLGVKMTIQVPQAFCWSNYWWKYGYARERILKCPMPSFEEMDAMAWMNIAGGANGLIFYSYFDILRRDEDKEDLPAIPFAKSFGDIKKVASRIKQNEKVLLADGEPEAYTVSSNPNDAVCFRAYGLDGETWILAVNMKRDVSSTFELAFQHPMTVAGTTLAEVPAKAEGNKITATLKPLQTVFLRLKKK